ncbi:hypothetical protein G7054_g8992 [Neopestalotiopsis clavispora]|nr:hypothetical protein G7054_g8992 [Neopestalotiopsis clavispora]
MHRLIKSHSIRYSSHGAPPGPSRTSTGASLNRSNTTSTSKKPHPDYVEVDVVAYNLKWAKLREWLVAERFKEYPELGDTLVKETNTQDRFRLWLPKDLTKVTDDNVPMYYMWANAKSQEDRTEIDKLRKRSRSQIVRNARHTPDREVSDDN